MNLLIPCLLVLTLYIAPNFTIYQVLKIFSLPKVVFFFSIEQSLIITSSSSLPSLYSISSIIMPRQRLSQLDDEYDSDLRVNPGFRGYFQGPPRSQPQPHGHNRDEQLPSPNKAHDRDFHDDHGHMQSRGDKSHFQPREGDHSQPPGYLQPHDHDHMQSYGFHDDHDQKGAAPPDVTRPYRFYPIKAPSSRRTSLITWFTAILCALLWTIIIVGGVTVLVIYLVFRPKSPRFEISSVTLNGAYLDMGTLLNADLTILANFTNPNHKIDVTFRYIAVDVYFEGTLIATQGVDRFSERAGESTLRDLHMVSSQVALSREQAAEWSKAAAGGSGGVRMEVKGSFLTTSDFVGTFLRFSYALYGRCHIAVSGPPSGVLLSSNCTTKR